MANSVHEQLRQHFSTGSTPSKWEDAWNNGLVPWDRGKPNPAFIDLLSNRQDLLGESTSRQPDGTIKRKKALVPGCGRGYDVLLLASFGYDAYGLDASTTAIEAAKKLAVEERDSYPLQTKVDTRGAMHFVAGDFFQVDWEKEISSGGKGVFDLIYDYTVCPSKSLARRAPSNN
jgi:SAM-dependent methyltransferase